MDTRDFTKSGIKVLWSLKFLGYFRTLSWKFQKARTKIEVVLALPCWLSQLNWDSQQGRLRTTSILVRAFWNFKRKVLKYSRNCSLHNTLIPNLVKPLIYIMWSWNIFSLILVLNLSTSLHFAVPSICHNITYLLKTDFLDSCGTALHIISCTFTVYF